MRTRKMSEPTPRGPEHINGTAKGWVNGPNFLRSLSLFNRFPEQSRP